MSVGLEPFTCIVCGGPCPTDREVMSVPTPSGWGALCSDACEKKHDQDQAD